MTDRRTATTFAAAIVLTGIAAAGLHVIDGRSVESLDFTLRASGRIAFLALIMAFAARPLQELLRKPWTAKLLRNRQRWFTG